MSSTHRLLTALVVGVLLLRGSDLLATGKFYVALSGDDNSDGRTPETAWQSVSRAAATAVAGDTIFIKAGHYRRERVVVKNSGTAEAPIVFQGYKDQPGDAPDPKYRPGDRLSPDVLPVLDGENAKAPGIQCEGKSYIEFRRLGLTRFSTGIYSYKSQHIVLDSVLAVNLGSVGLNLLDCAHCTVRNCVVTDAGDDNIILLRTHNSVVENCKTYGVIFDPPPAAPDYYIVLCDGHDNVVRDCLSWNLHPEQPVHPGHGIGIKDQARADGYPAPHSCNNKIINCVARNNGESFFVAHEAHHNEFVNCTVLHQWRTAKNRWNEGINIRDGAHDNVFRNCRVEGARCGATIQDTVEGPKGPDGKPVAQICSGNVLANCVFTDAQDAFEIWNAVDNQFRNCVVENVEDVLVRFLEGKNQGTVLRNTIVANVRGAYLHADKSGGDVRFTYSNFWGNRFPPPDGVGNLAKDPLFADPAKKDFHLRSAEGRWDAASSCWVKDQQTSPCIDAGDPSDGCAAEPQPNGGRINIGAYGGTAEASKSRPRGG